MPANLKQLTSLRFFAAAWVVAYTYWPSLTGSRPLFVEKGYLGVELFFVLSGFILSHVYLDQAGSGRLNFAAFLWARLSRIYPVHLITLAGVGLMGAAALAIGYSIENAVIVWSAFLQNLFLVHAWGTTSSAAWNHPSWSISAEWFAYLTFPLYASAAWRLRNRPYLAVAGVLVFIAVLYPAFERVAGFALTEATIAWGALRIVPCFALGCAVNLLWRSKALANPTLAAIAAGAIAALVVGSAAARAPDLVPVMLFGGLIFALASLASTGSRLLTAAPFVYLGEVSFAVYMVCIPWQLAFSKAAALVFGLESELLPSWMWLLQLGSLLAAAAAVHHAVERPARTWMRRHAPALPFRARALQVQAG